MKYPVTRLILILALLLSSFARAATAGPIPEYEMKAAYLYNFASLTSWPEHQSGQIRLCVLGKDSFKGGLEKLASSTTGRLSINLTYLPHLKASSDCQMLFIDSSEQANAEDILQYLENQPILTVTDNLEIFNSGAMIGLFVENKRLIFDVNYLQTKNAQLTVSSKLLRVARRVLQ
jgi:hypothetical protein